MLLVRTVPLVTVLALLALLPACSSSDRRTGVSPRDAATAPSHDLTLDPDASFPDDLAGDALFNPDAACAVATEKADVQTLPVDIIWLVDNSSSMKPAVDAVTAGLNDFATLIANSQLDYRIIMLSVRSETSPTLVAGSTRYPVCIPPPLAGDAHCGNGPNFFHSNIDIKSTQPLEQFLGTLGQTKGYLPGTVRGGEPWAAQLRPNASRTIVLVTDDNSRLLPNDFEHFPGGPNPNNLSLTLPPGILDPSWNGQFDNYTFDAIYGWGDPQNPGIRCAYPGGGSPPSAGPAYSDLVMRTGGVRAKICDGAAAWGPFFTSVAQAVVKASKLSCNLAIPTPRTGTIDSARINVFIDGKMGPTTLPKVANAAACAMIAGWYYDDDLHPTHVLLCPAACALAQSQVKDGASIQIAFGCDTIIQ